MPVITIKPRAQLSEKGGIAPFDVIFAIAPNNLYCRQTPSVITGSGSHRHMGIDRAQKRWRGQCPAAVMRHLQSIGSQMFVRIPL
ncbi:hypothetical protein ACZ87_02308 [Candidatus Erwinia dacicola]|uniref:Uncharacterized protein n=1 Tax=Candidatus Erwinia dacicola TaxID=252393 RepID=A0A328TJT6_9GAMM|nr:hypothetical protein ACZ87_02308 [Candidatus Erwinia dacicola]